MVLIKKISLGKVYKLKHFIQIHRKQQKDGFYLFVVVEVTSFQIDIIHKQQKRCQYICFYIAFINFIQNDTKVMHSMGKIFK